MDETNDRCHQGRSLLADLHSGLQMSVQTLDPLQPTVEAERASRLLPGHLQAAQQALLQPVPHRQQRRRLLTAAGWWVPCQLQIACSEDLGGCSRGMGKSGWKLGRQALAALPAAFSC